MANIRKPQVTPIIAISSSSDSSGESSMEKAIYSLLFKECDKDNLGLVDVKELVGYIKRMQQQVRRHGEEEEIFDSQDGSGFEDYDLQVLQSMLDTNCDHMNRIDQATYTDIISKWVKSVREQHPQVDASSPRSPRLTRTTLELSQMSNSPYLSQEEQDHPNYSFGSYEMEKTRSSLDSSRDHELNDLVSKYQREIKLLNDRNKELLLQHEHSEETLKDYQARARQLQMKLDEAHSSVKKFQHLETSNVELHQEVSETVQENKDLTWAKDRLNRELDKLKDELSEARDNLSAAEMDRKRAMEEVKTMQQVVVKTKEEGRETQHLYETKLCESKSQLDLVTRDLEDAHNLNTELKSCITELESQLHEQQRQQRHQPFSSTPHRHTPSLHDEIMGQEGLANDSSVSPLKYSRVDYSTPMGEDGQEEEISRSIRREFEVSPAMESLAKLVDETDSVVQHKHSLIMRDLGDLVFQSSPSTTHQNNTTTTMLAQDEISLNKVETKLKSMMRKKNQFKNENMNLKRENSDLKEQLKRLEEQLSQNQPPSASPRYYQPSSPILNRAHHSTSPSHFTSGDSYQLGKRSRSPVLFVKDDTEADPVTGRHSPTFVSVTINPNQRPSENEDKGHVVIETSDRPIDSGFKSKSPRRVEFSDGRLVGHTRSRSLSPTRLYPTTFPPPKVTPHSQPIPLPTGRTQHHATYNVIPPRSATPPPRSTLSSGFSAFKDPTFSSGLHSSLLRSQRDHSNGVTFAPEGTQFAETILDSTHPPKDYVEDPSLDVNFKRGDFSPRYQSSLKPERRFDSLADEELIKDVREVFTSTIPNVSMSPQRSPGATSTHPLAPAHDGIDHGGLGASPLPPQALPRRRFSEGDPALPSHLQYSEQHPPHRRRISEGDCAQLSHLQYEQHLLHSEQHSPSRRQSDASHLQHSEPHPPQACPRHQGDSTPPSRQYSESHPPQAYQGSGGVSASPSHQYSEAHPPQAYARHGDGSSPPSHHYSEPHSPQACPRHQVSGGDSASPSHHYSEPHPSQVCPKHQGSGVDSAPPSHHSSEPHPPQACPRHRTGESTDRAYGPTGEEFEQPPYSRAYSEPKGVESRRLSQQVTFSEPERQEGEQASRKSSLVGSGVDTRERGALYSGPPRTPPPTSAPPAEPALPEESLQHAYNDLQTALIEPRGRGGGEDSRKPYSEVRLTQRSQYESQFSVKQEEGSEHPTYRQREPVYEPPAEMQRIVDSGYRPDLEAFGGAEGAEEMRREYDNTAPSQQSGQSSLMTDTTHCFYNIYQTLKITVLALFLSVLILALILLLVLSRDAVDGCGSYNPHSPVHLLYSSLEPYIHFHKDNPPI